MASRCKVPLVSAVLYLIGFILSAVTLCDIQWWNLDYESSITGHIYTVGISLWGASIEEIQPSEKKLAGETCRSSEDCVDGTLCRRSLSKCLSDSDCISKQQLGVTSSCDFWARIPNRLDGFNFGVEPNRPLSLFGRETEDKVLPVKILALCSNILAFLTFIGLIICPNNFGFVLLALCNVVLSLCVVVLAAAARPGCGGTAGFILHLISTILWIIGWFLLIVNRALLVLKLCGEEEPTTDEEYNTPAPQKPTKNNDPRVFPCDDESNWPEADPPVDVNLDTSDITSGSAQQKRQVAWEDVHSDSVTTTTDRKMRKHNPLYRCFCPFAQVPR